MSEAHVVERTMIEFGEPYQLVHASGDEDGVCIACLADEMEGIPACTEAWEEHEGDAICGTCGHSVQWEDTGADL